MIKTQIWKILALLVSILLVAASYGFYQYSLLAYIFPKANQLSFNSTFTNDDNTMYAIVTADIECPKKSIVLQENPWKRIEPDGTEHCSRDKILISNDFGKTWKDITGDIPVGFQLSRIFKDPDDSSKICVQGNSIRMYVLRISSRFLGNYKWEAIPFGQCNKPETLLVVPRITVIP